MPEAKKEVIWVMCPSCGAVALSDDGHIPNNWPAPEIEYTSTGRFRRLLRKGRYIAEQHFMACNICMEFVCPTCLTDHEGNLMEWCIACETKEKGLRVDHPDPRLRIDAVSLTLLREKYK